MRRSLNLLDWDAWTRPAYLEVDMLRRSFLATTIASFFVRPRLLLSAPTRKEFRFTDVPFSDLRLLRVYTLLDNGTKVEHTVNWYGRIRFPYQWSIVVSDTLKLDKPTASIAKIYEINGKEIGRVSGSFPDKLSSGEQDQIAMHFDGSGIETQDIVILDRHPRHMVSIQSYLAITANATK